MRYPRYPSVASEPIDNLNDQDFKTPYRESVHHIRYLNESMPLDRQYVVRDPLREKPVEKLVRLHMLRPEDVGNAQAVEAAKQNYEKIHGEALENKGKWECAHFFRFQCT